MKKNILLILASLFYLISFSNNQRIANYDGETDYVEFEFHQSYQSFSNFTLEATINSGSILNEYGVIFSNFDANNQGLKWGVTHEGKLFLQINDLLYVDESQVLDENCHHIGITRNENIIKFYVDFELTETIESSEQFNSHAKAYIGTDINLNNSYFKDYLDNVYIWDHARSASEMEEFRIECLKDFEHAILAINFDENQNQNIHDLSPNGNHGINGNAHVLDFSDIQLIEENICEIEICCEMESFFQSNGYLTHIPLNTNVTFSNSSVGSSSYEWFVDGNLVSTSNHLTYTFTNRKLYKITLLAKDDECKSYFSQNYYGVPKAIIICNTSDPCNLVCDGDFENFNINVVDPLFPNNDFWFNTPGALASPTPNTTDLYDGTNTLLNNPLNYTSTNSILENSLPCGSSLPSSIPPSHVNGGNQYVGIALIDAPNPVFNFPLQYEGITLSLSSPILPGVTYDIGCLNNMLNQSIGCTNPLGGEIVIWGSSVQPCELSESDLPICTTNGCLTNCQGSSFLPARNYIPTELYRFTPVADNNWDLNSTIYTHPVGAAQLEFITIFTQSSSTPDYYYLLLDNVYVKEYINAEFTSSNNCNMYSFTSNSTIGSHQWNFNDGPGSASINTPNATWSFSSSGTYNVEHTVTVNGCTKTEMTEIIVSTSWPKFFANIVNSVPAAPNGYILGIGKDATNNVYSYRYLVDNANNKNAYIEKYCLDGTLEWSTLISDYSNVGAHYPNSRIAVDNIGNSYVLGFKSGLFEINKLDNLGQIIQTKTFSGPLVPFGDRYWSLKVSEDGNNLYLLYNNVIYKLNPSNLNVLSQTSTDFYRSISIDQSLGNNIYYTKSNASFSIFEMGFFNSSNLNSSIVILSSSMILGTDFEFDEANNRLYIPDNTGDVISYTINTVNGAILNQDYYTNVISSPYYELFPTSSGLLIFNSANACCHNNLNNSTIPACCYTGTTPNGLTSYSLNGTLLWQLPFNGVMGYRSPIFMNKFNNYLILGTGWDKHMNIGPNNINNYSGTFLARIDLNSGLFGKTSDETDMQEGLNSNINESSLQIYPNPSNAVFNITYQVYEETEINLDVYDIIGKKILNKTYNNSLSIDEDLNLKNFPKGTYFIFIKTEFEMVSKRIILN